jgi:ATP-dependent helicase HepA
LAGLGPQRLSSYYVNRWLRRRSAPELGFGKVTANDRGQLQIQYFDIPGKVDKTDSPIAKEDLEDRSLPLGTRVWLKGKPYGWQPGIVKRILPDSRYEIQPLRNTERRLIVDQTLFCVRRNLRLQDPVMALAEGYAESPTFHDARSALADEFLRQHQISRGFSAVLSAPIDLHKHQIETAARVLSDPVMRYLLADEVGLGKTIEAGLVARQVLLDDSTSKVLVLCPDNLVGQWVLELRNRLALGIYLDCGRILVEPHSRISGETEEVADGLTTFSLIVIDEAHRFLDVVEPDSHVERELDGAKGLLALSATPMRGEIDVFRRLLRLVDPVVFGDISLEDFHGRMRLREETAEHVDVLSSPLAGMLMKNKSLMSIETNLGHDDNIAKMAIRCRATSSAQAPEWNELAEYVREIYRISRRMIRHRRTPELLSSFPITGRKATIINVQETARGNIDDFLERYRDSETAEESPESFKDLVQCALAGPIALRGYLQECGEVRDEELFNSMIARIDMTASNGRLSEAAKIVGDRVDKGMRVVVVSEFPQVLDQFKILLEGEVDRWAIFHHRNGMTVEEQDEEVDFFIGEHEGGVLLGDSSIEEGRNLQEAEVLVNLDVPLDVNRLDQRIGRLDRFSHRTSPAEVVVFNETDSDWVSAHVDLLNLGFRVLDQSVSSAQLFIASTLGALTSRLQVDGVTALQIDLENLREELDRERQRGDFLEELESLDAGDLFPSSAFNQLVEYELNTGALEEAFLRFTTGVGSLDLNPRKDPDGIIGLQNAAATGLSHQEVKELESLFTPQTFNRLTALAFPGTSLFRIGDPLVTWLENYLEDDERGLVSAIVRPSAVVHSPKLFIKCEFLIQFGQFQIEALDRSQVQTLQRRGASLFQPRKLETWTDQDGLVLDEKILDELSKDFDSGFEKVLQGEIWQPVLEQLPEWSRECRSCGTAAREHVFSSEELFAAQTSSLENLEMNSNLRLGVLESRGLLLPTGPEQQSAIEEARLERESKLACISGIQSPSVIMISSLAIVLWPEGDFKGAFKSG